MYSHYREHFLKTYESSGITYRTFPHHVDIVAKWAERLCDLYPEADRDVAIIAAWFHDLGHFIGDEMDHAINSEKEAKRFLEQEKLPKEKISKILHAVRAHRNNDVKPESIEAKIVCCADSASHLTAEVYLTIYGGHSKESALGKLDRDYRDLSDFPEIKSELTPLYLAWKSLIESFPEDFVQYIQR